MCDENRQVNRVYTYGTLTKQGMALTVQFNRRRLSLLRASFIF
ncbi:hypothetical protein ACT7DZ_38875 [Bacillus cereus]